MASKTVTTEERIGRVGQRRQVIIPRQIFENLNLQEGDLVAFSETRNGVLVKPKRVIDPDDVLTPGEAKKVRHALKQVGFIQRWMVVVGDAYGLSTRISLRLR
jgi:AbrB family looped-hinge helix DNA binding protein